MHNSVYARLCPKDFSHVTDWSSQLYGIWILYSLGFTEEKSEATSGQIY